MLTHVDLHACDYFDTQQLEKVDPRETNRLGWFVDVPNKSSVEFVYFPICFRFSEQNLHLKNKDVPAMRNAKARVQSDSWGRTLFRVSQRGMRNISSKVVNDGS